MRFRFASPTDWQTTNATASASVSRTCLVVSVRRSPRCNISWAISCDKRGKFLGGLHPGKQRDLPAIRETLRGSNSLGETELDALRFNELKQTFAVSAHVAVDFGQCWEFFAFGLS